MLSGAKRHQRNQSSGQYYFVTHNPGNSESVRDRGDDVAVLETKGPGTREEEYQARPVNRNLEVSKTDGDRNTDNQKQTFTTQRLNPLSRTLFAIFGGGQQNKPDRAVTEGAKKVDPKVFFANERTFLKWMNVSVWVAGISIGLSVVAGNASAQNKIFELTSSLAFLAMAIVIVCYSMYQYGRRSFMVVTRSPGPFEDVKGPVVIGSLFVLVFTAKYCMFVASLSYGELRR